MTLAKIAQEKFNLHASDHIWKNHLDQKKKNSNCKSIVANITHPNGICWPPRATPRFQHSQSLYIFGPVFSIRVCSEMPAWICQVLALSLDPRLCLPHCTLISQAALSLSSFSSITQDSGLSLFVTSEFRCRPGEMYTMSRGKVLF